MGMWDEVSEGNWGSNPIFPMSQGEWIPLTLFSVAERLEIDPVVTLLIVANLAYENGIEINSDTDIRSVLTIATHRHIGANIPVAINSILNLNIQSDWVFRAGLSVGGGEDISIGSNWSFTSDPVINKIAMLAVSQGLLSMSSSGLVYNKPVSNSTSLAAISSSTIRYTGNVSLSRQATVGSPLSIIAKRAVNAASALIVSSGSSAGFPPKAPFYTEFSEEIQYTFPKSYDYLVIGGIGGGASGQTGNGGVGTDGKGGNPGSWAFTIVQRGPNPLPMSMEFVNIYPGRGGAQAANSDNAGPNGGTSSQVWTPDGPILTAAGGSGRASGQNGGSPGNYTNPYTGQVHTGGSGGTGNGGDGSAPGGGGAGGNGGLFGSRTRGGAGGNGRVWLSCHQE